MEGTVIIVEEPPELAPDDLSVREGFSELLRWKKLQMVSKLLAIENPVALGDLFVLSSE